MFTDGPKRFEGVGAAVVWDGGVRMATLLREVSIFSAELYAIPMAVSVIGELAEMPFVIMSDLFSVLKAISDIRNRHPVIRKVFHEIAQMRDRNKEI